jgi:hypothetical protein
MTDHDATETWVVGPEHDDRLRARLGEVLRALGCRIDHREWGVAGSQEISTWDVHSASGMLRIEAETYVGLTVTGPRNLVDAVRQRFAQAPKAQ